MLSTSVCVALTATATPDVQDDIKKTLLRSSARSFKSSCFRPNLFYEVKFRDIIEDQYDDLKEFCLTAFGMDEKEGTTDIDWVGVS